MRKHEFVHQEGPDGKWGPRCVFCGTTPSEAQRCPPGCRVYGEPCPEHGFIHGAEANELREGIEAILETDCDVEDVEGIRRALQRLLDRVDARDSLAYLEAARTEGEVL